MQRLLVAIDLSARSDRAVQRAALLCGPSGASLCVLNVLDDAARQPDGSECSEPVGRCYTHSCHTSTSTIRTPMPSSPSPTSRRRDALPADVRGEMAIVLSVMPGFALAKKTLELFRLDPKYLP